MNISLFLWFYLVLASISDIKCVTTHTTATSQSFTSGSTQHLSTTRQTATITTPSTTTSPTTKPTSKLTATPAKPASTPKYVKKFPFENVKDLLGPRKVVDIVFLIARNIKVGKRNFYETSRPLTMSLLKDYASVHKDFARVAYVTFANDSSVDYDDISVDKDPIDKCTMFPSVNTTSFPLDTVIYINEQDTSTNGVDEAIIKVNSIFAKGRSKRRNVNQILFWLTDGDVFTEETIDTNVEIFAIGVGKSQTEISLQGLVRNNDNADSKDAWEEFIKKFPPLNKFADPLILNLPDSSCYGLQAPLMNNINRTNCFCDVDYGVLRMKCKQDFIEVLDPYTAERLGDYDFTRKCLKTDELTDLCSVNECTSNLCQFNGQKCINYISECTICMNNLDSQKTESGCNCRCRKEYYGPMCEIKEVSCRFTDLCTNNNTCLNEVISFKCKCSPGFRGEFCENRVISSTTAKPVINTDSLNIKASTIAGIVVGAIILSILLLGFIILIALCSRKHCDNKKKVKKHSEIGVSAGNKGSMSKWSVKNKNNLSVRLSELWKQRSLRGFKANDGMPSVPWKTKGKLSYMDTQNVSQEEAVFENEVIHDNRPVMDNWKMFMANLVEKNTIENGMIVNIFTKDIVTTDNWDFNWSEVYTLDTIFGTDTNVSVQEEDYFLKAPVEGVASGKSGAQFSDERQTLVAVAKTKKYLIAAIVALSESQDGSECISEVRSIMNHVKTEGY